MIYLDNAATTYPKSESVYSKMDWANRNLAFNAGRGSYSVAQKATELIDETRKMLLDLVHSVGTEKAILTTSATEALNILIKGINWKEHDIVYISPYEHNAVARTLELIRETKNIVIKLLPTNDASKEIDIEQTKYLLLKDKPVCVCCTHVSNVTGYILPVNCIFEIAKQVGAITILDASQSFGVLDIDVKALNADFIAFAGHKTLYGPFGIAGFLDINNISLQISSAGGTGSDSLNLKMPSSIPERYEYGSKNIVAIAGLNQALREINLDETFKKEKELASHLIKRLQEIEDVELYLPDNCGTSHIGVVSFNIHGFTAEDVGNILNDEFDIAVRTGNHCAPYVHELLNDFTYQGTVRVGLGKYNTFEEIDALIEAINAIIQG